MCLPNTVKALKHQKPQQNKATPERQFCASASEKIGIYKLSYWTKLVKNPAKTTRKQRTDVGARWRMVREQALNSAFALHVAVVRFLL